MTTPRPIRLNAEVAAGRDLDLMSDWPEDVRITGAHPSRLRTWFEGQVSAYVIHIPDGELRFSNVTFDEVCVVLEGAVTLTPIDGEAETFRAGEVYVIPKGFDGTFAPSGAYRAMTVMSTEAASQLFSDWQLGVEPDADI